MRKNLSVEDKKVQRENNKIHKQEQQSILLEKNI